MTPREFVGHSVPGLDAEAVQARVLAEQRNQNGLMGGLRDNQVSLDHEGVHQKLGLFVVPDVIKSRVGRVGRIKQRSGTVVLKDQIVPLRGAVFLVEPFQGISVPEHVHVLEEQVVAELRHQVDAIDLGQHDAAVPLVSVFLGGLRGHRPKDGLAVKAGQAHGRDKLVGLGVRRKDQNVVERLGGFGSPSAGVANKVQEELCVPVIADDHHDRVVRVVCRDSLGDGLEFRQNVIEGG
mmetsp:Transcript_17025/g.46746  ORF Transcript_17025/g.46746 Transcript_17025/m.46746 type:complete len:237 (+) Transcript_17025:1221-1931(+)